VPCWLGKKTCIEVESSEQKGQILPSSKRSEAWRHMWPETTALMPSPPAASKGKRPRHAGLKLKVADCGSKVHAVPPGASPWYLRPSICTWLRPLPIKVAPMPLYEVRSDSQGLKLQAEHARIAATFTDAEDAENIQSKLQGDSIVLTLVSDDETTPVPDRATMADACAKVIEIDDAPHEIIEVQNKAASREVLDQHVGAAHNLGTCLCLSTTTSHGNEPEAMEHQQEGERLPDEVSPREWWREEALEESIALKELLQAAILDEAQQQEAHETLMRRQKQMEMEEELYFTDSSNDEDLDSSYSKTLKLSQGDGWFLSRLG